MSNLFKVLIINIIIGTSVGFSGTIFDKYIKPSYQPYLVPCASVIGAGSFLGTSKNALVTIATACTGALTYHYIMDNQPKNSETRQQLKKLNRELKSQIIKNDLVAKKNYSQFRDSIRKIVLEEFSEQDKRLAKSIRDMKKRNKKIKNPKGSKSKKSSPKLDEDRIVNKIVEKLKEGLGE